MVVLVLLLGGITFLVALYLGGIGTSNQERLDRNFHVTCATFPAFSKPSPPDCLK